MARKPIVIDTGSESDTVNVRVDIPKNVWALMVEVGRRQAQRLMPRSRFTDERVGVIGAGLLMEHLGELAVKGSVEHVFGPAFEKARLKQAAGNLGVASTDGIKIDLNRLHRSDKVKSGFFGVYASGLGFRAMGVDFAGRQVVVGTYPTAEEAAHRRWEHYKRNGLPYGELEEEIERWKSDPRELTTGLSDAEIAAKIENHMQMVGTWETVFGPQCVTMRAARPKLPTREEALARGLKAAPQAALAAGDSQDDELEDIGAPEPRMTDTKALLGFDEDDLPDVLK